MLLQKVRVNSQHEEGVGESPRTQEHKNLTKQLETLTTEEMIRRLRVLKQPATLFGEEDIDRLKRLLKVNPSCLPTSSP